MHFSGDTAKLCPGEKTTPAHFDKAYHHKGFVNQPERVQMALILKEKGRRLWVLPAGKEADQLLHEIFNISPGFSTVANIEGLPELIDTYSISVPEGETGLIAWAGNLHGESEAPKQRLQACRIYCGLHYVAKEDKPKLLNQLIQMAYLRLVCEIDYASFQITNNKSRFDCVNNKSTQCYKLRQGVDERVVAALNKSLPEMKAALRDCSDHDLFLVGLLPQDLE
jgi:hypothetical protein